jgi:hypothetical protein
MSKSNWSLRLSLLMGGAVILLLPAIVAGSIYTSKVRTQTVDLLSQGLKDRGEWGARQMIGRLDRLWQHFTALSKEIDMADPNGVRNKFNLFAQLDNRFSWLGVADINGKVLVSSQGMLENASVAERPWFREGLNGPFAGDVHKAVLLENLLPKREEAYRFIDFSMPILGRNGETIAVFGAHLDWAWIRQLIDGFHTDQADVLLMSQDRRVLHGSGAADLYGKELSTGTAVAASMGAGATRIERWPDGRDYLALSVPIRSAEDAPSFGWSFVVRSDLAKVAQQSGGFLRTYWMLTAAALAVSLLGLVALAAWLAAPVTRAALFARRLADDQTAGTPEEASGCHEARQLTAALTKLQSQLATVTQLRKAG